MSLFLCHKYLKRATIHVTQCWLCTVNNCTGNKKVNDYCKDRSPDLDQKCQSRSRWDQLSPTNAFKHIENGCHWIKTTNSVNYVQFILEREQVENHLHASLSRHLKLPPPLPCKSVSTGSPGACTRPITCIMYSDTLACMWHR